MTAPKLEPRHTQCTTADECVVYQATYSAEGCCPELCGMPPDAIAVNMEGHHLLDRHCYDRIIPLCDRSEAKVACDGPRPIMQCLEGTCAARRP